MADVKFSELTSLAGTALASDDIFAVVDTSATTSKKLTVDNLFASVPVNIGQSDATDATSSDGAIRTAGGVSMAKKLYVGTTSTLVGKMSTENMSLDMGTAAAATTTTITSAASGTAKTITLPNATDTLVGKATTDTLTNKTLTTPVIASLQQASGTNTLTMPAATDTLVGKATTDTLTNKTLTAPKIADAGFIADANGNEILQFETTTSAVNHIFVQNATTTNRAVLGSTEADVGMVFMNDPGQNEEMLILDPIETAVNEVTIQNSATGGNAAAATSTAPVISATGTDSNVDLGVLAKGTGHFTVRGTSIQGAIRLNCENNTHGQILQSQPHSAAQSNYLTLPSGTGSQGSPDFLMSRTSTDTMTNKTLTSPVMTTQKVDTSITTNTDATDVIFAQVDGHEVARIHDGATAATLETGTQDLTAAAAGKGGFGYKKAVYNLTADGDDEACVLTAAHSGAVIMVTGAGYDLDITLPTIAAGEEGWHCTIVVTTAFSGTNNLEIATAGAGSDNDDTIHLYTQVATAVTVDASGDTVISAADIPAGTMFELLAVKGGSAEQWICKAYQISGSAPTTGTAPA